MSKFQKAKLGLIQMTIPSEKAKALERDGCCINCKSHQGLDFHHVYWHASERKYSPDRNLAKNGVILCRACHTQIPTKKDLDLFCRQYLDDYYGN